MREVEPDLPIFGETTLDALFAANISTPRLTTLLLGAFAGLALLLAAFGLYGVLNYHVDQRTRELGVRLALGAAPRTLVQLVVRQGLKLAGLGLAGGLLAALALAHLLTRVLYGVSRFDPASFVAVALVLAAVAGLACFLPARRATRVDPMIALRAE
jgi:putative ABC transport system permease protein